MQKVHHIANTLGLATVATIAMLCIVATTGCATQASEFRPVCVELGDKFFALFVKGDLRGAADLGYPSNIKVDELDELYRKWSGRIPKTAKLIHSTEERDYEDTGKGAVRPPAMKVEGAEGVAVDLQYWMLNEPKVLAFGIQESEAKK